MRILRAIWRIALFVMLTMLLVPLQYLVAAWRAGDARRRTQQSPVVRWWYRGVLAILNIQVDVIGAPPVADARRMLYMANHSSYLDIMLLGAHLPAYFVAKADTANWPVFGFLIRIGDTVFISRQRSQVRQQMHLFGEALRSGRHLLLFPEGTTSDGLQVLPFKSGLLNVLAEPDLRDTPVVPVCITYQTVNGEPFTAVNNDLVAWYANMTLLPHLWRVFQQRSITARLDMLPALTDETLQGHAKQLAAAGEGVIRAAFAADRPAPLASGRS